MKGRPNFQARSELTSYQVFEGPWTEALWSYPPQIGVNGYAGSGTTMRDTELYWFFDPTVNDKNDIIPFPLTRVPRGYQTYWWFGKLAGGEQIKPGNYT